MLIEFYKSSDEVPALYDFFVTTTGGLLPMYPKVERVWLVQVVLEKQEVTPSGAQLLTMYALIDAMKECEVAFFDLDGITSPG